MTQDVNNHLAATAPPTGRASPLGTALVPGNRTRAFGGSTLAALLRAAAVDVDPAHRPLTLHARFIAPADPLVEVTLPTRVVARSRSFTTMMVEAVQADATAATATVSFHRPRTSRDHTATATPAWFAPAAAPPAHGGALPTEDQPARAAFDFRFADASPLRGTDGRRLLRYWVRHRGPLASPLEHAIALTWVSDLCLTRIADLDHEASPGVRQAASLDHTVWYHRPFDLGNWLLYETSSPSYADEIALSTGRFFADGVLVASTAQQSLLRRDHRTPGATSG